MYIITVFVQLFQVTIRVELVLRIQGPHLLKILGPPFRKRLLFRGDENEQYFAVIWGAAIHFHVAFRIYSQSDLTLWLGQLEERQSAVREVDGSSPRLDQHSGS